jgi:hypothetical protein
MIQKPVALSLVLCEQVIIEEKTRNMTPVNCFRRHKVDKLPSDNFSFVCLLC